MMLATLRVSVRRSKLNVNNNRYHSQKSLGSVGVASSPLLAAIILVLKTVALRGMNSGTMAAIKTLY